VSQEIVAGLIVATFLVFAVYRQTRERKVTPWGMWIAPIIFTALAALIIAIDHLTSPLALAVVIAAAAVGIPLGWYQGTHCSVEVDRARRQIVYKANPIGVAVLLGALGFRFGIKLATGSLMTSHALSEAQELISTAALSLAIGMVIGLRIYLHRRYNEEPLPVA